MGNALIPIGYLDEDDEEKLTPRQYLFVEEYLKEFSGVKAAQAAGYGKTYSTSAFRSTKLLQNPHIQAVIRRQLEKRAMGTDEFLARLADQARGLDSSHFITHDADGKLLPEPVLDIHKILDEGKAHLIKRMRPTKHGCDVELYSAQKALELVGRYLGVFRERVETVNIQAKVDLNEVIEALPERLRAQVLQSMKRLLDGS